MSYGQPCSRTTGAVGGAGFGVADVQHAGVDLLQRAERGRGPGCACASARDPRVAAAAASAAWLTVTCAVPRFETLNYLMVNAEVMTGPFGSDVDCVTLRVNVLRLRPPVCTCFATAPSHAYGGYVHAAPWVLKTKVSRAHEHWATSSATTRLADPEPPMRNTFVRRRATRRCLAGRTPPTPDRTDDLRHRRRLRPVCRRRIACGSSPSPATKLRLALGFRGTGDLGNKDSRRSIRSRWA